MSERDLLIEGFHKGLYRSEAEDIAHGRRHRVTWDDIAAYGSCYPELEKNAHKLIEDNLGYLPEAFIYIPHEPFLRALIADIQAGRILVDSFEAQARLHVKNIRNDDMEKNGWSFERPLEQGDYELYETQLGAFKELARERLKRLLGFEPELEYSLYAEIFLRQLFLFDEFNIDMVFISLDYRAATIYRYREALVLYGRETANHSALVGLH